MYPAVTQQATVNSTRSISVSCTFQNQSALEVVQLIHRCDKNFLFHIIESFPRA